MPKKEDTPLQALVKESDALQKKVSTFDKECSSYFKKKDKKDPEKGKDLYERCKDYQSQLEEFKDRLENLDQEAENMKPNKFESKKKDEMKKYKNMEDKLNKHYEKLKPEEEEEEEEEEEANEEEEEEEKDDEKKDQDRKKPKGKDKEESEDEDEESEEDDYDDDEGETEEETDDKKKKEDKHIKDKVKKTVTMKDTRDDEDEEKEKSKTTKEREEDEDEEDITEAEEEDEEVEDEEEEAEEESEEEEEEEEEEEDEEEEEEEEEESDEEDVEEETDMDQTSTMRQYIALDDFPGEQNGDLGFQKGEILTIIAARSDGWLEAENSEGKRGLVPITYLQVYNKNADLEKEESEEEDIEDEEGEALTTTTPQTPKSARELWKDIKSAVKETSATDVLHALGAMPAGFRESTLFKLSKQDQYSIKCMLTPKLSQSCVAFRDLFLDEATNMLRPHTVRMQKIITIIQAKLIPLPGTGVEVISRQARVCLFDGQNVLSNIHTIKMTNTDKEQKTWNFNNKITDLKHSVEFSEVFIRTNSSDPNLGVLIELCVTFKRTSTGQEGELSCGWVHFKLCDQDGKHLPPKTYDEFVNGGTIYERGVDVDPSVGRKASKTTPSGSSKFRSLVAGNKQPRLILRIADPTKEQKLYLDTLPDVMVSSTAYISYISYCRHLQADLILRDREDQQSSELIYGPVLNGFMEAVEQPDLMDVLRTCWADEMKSMKRNDKKEIAVLKEHFRRVFMHNVYPLTLCASLPEWDVRHDDVIKERYEEIQRIHSMNKAQKIPKSLLSADVSHKPLNITSLAFSIVNPHCMLKAHGI